MASPTLTSGSGWTSPAASPTRASGRNTLQFLLKSISLGYRQEETCLVCELRDHGYGGGHTGGAGPLPHQGRVPGPARSMDTMGGHHKQRYQLGRHQLGRHLAFSASTAQLLDKGNIWHPSISQKLLLAVWEVLTTATKGSSTSLQGARLRWLRDASGGGTNGCWGSWRSCWRNSGWGQTTPQVTIDHLFYCQARRKATEASSRKDNISAYSWKGMGNVYWPGQAASFPTWNHTNKLSDQLWCGPQLPIRSSSLNLLSLGRKGYQQHISSELAAVQ